MIDTKGLLAAAKAVQGITSNYRLARVLDVPERTVQRWSTGRNLPANAYATRLAQLADLDPAEVVAAINAERAKDDATRSMWVGIAERLHRAGAALCVILSLGFWSGGPDGGALASTAHPERSAAQTCLYLMSTSSRNPVMLGRLVAR